MHILDEIANLYYKISSIYSELYLLELSGKKADVSFSELVLLLKTEKEEENRLYCQLKNEYRYVYNYLCKLGDMSGLFGKRLYDCFSFYHDFIFLMNDDKIEHIKLCNACLKDIFLVYISFLQEIIDSEAFVLIRDELLNYKYYSAFINHDVESVLVDLDFDISRVNYICLDVVIDTLKLNRDLCEDIIFKCYFNTVKIAIRQLLSVCDIGYNDDNMKIVSLKSQCMLRTGLALLNEDDYEKIEGNIHDEISSLSNENNKISVDIVKSILNERKKDMGRVRKISMKPIY